MKLEYATIKNFRSIKEVQIDFAPSCRILVGINESGKSNILNALGLLGESYELSRIKDTREPLPGEGNIQDSDSYVEFAFKFEREESDELFRIVSSEIIAEEEDPQIISYGQGNISLSEFCRTHCKGLYRVDINSGERISHCQPLRNQYALLPEWKKLNSEYWKAMRYAHFGNRVPIINQKALSMDALVRVSDFGSSIPQNLAFEKYWTDASIRDFQKLLSNAVSKMVEANLPKVVLWKDDEKNLLPSSINISDFQENPDSCIPLKNIFLLQGIKDDEIGKQIAEYAKEGPSNKLQNYLDRIAQKATKHVRETWKEYANIEFSLKASGEKILPGIKEKNTYDFAERSDGFKSFVSFLLMVSARVNTSDLKNALLLIDEPDIGLHPSGARYLRDELIRISKTNHVIYSTHSIFMIDSDNISRHLIVKKDNEITSVEQVKESNIRDEEVIYNALGYSVFSILKEKNLIFEGWRDKHLFSVFLEKTNEELKRKFKNVGICHAKGVNTIKWITPMLELANRRCLIISDSDDPAKKKQKEYQTDKNFGDWKTYQDIAPSIEAITGDDFIRNEFIAKQVNTILSGDDMAPLDKDSLPEQKKLVAISEHLTRNGMTGEEAKETIKKAKDLIFDNLKHTDIDEAKYRKLLEDISLEF